MQKTNLLFKILHNYTIPDYPCLKFTTLPCFRPGIKAPRSQSDSTFAVRRFGAFPPASAVSRLFSGNGICLKNLYHTVIDNYLFQVFTAIIRLQGFHIRVSALFHKFGGFFII